MEANEIRMLKSEITRLKNVASKMTKNSMQKALLSRAAMLEEQIAKAKT